MAGDEVLADRPIRLSSSLATFYPSSSRSGWEGARWKEITDKFAQWYGHQPTYVARAPGRVNLIGEHIDYCLFGVLPAAVERDILVAISPSEDSASTTVRLQNVDHKYEEVSFDPTRDEKGEWSTPIDTKKLQWDSYVKAGYLGVLNHFFTDPQTKPKGANIVVYGSVPLGGGLSSSAALVVASTLAFLAANDKIKDITQGGLVEIAMENEKRVGVNSGGMDQAASMFSSNDSAIYVSFWPKLHVAPVHIPQTSPPAIFVITNTLKTANKLETAKIHYNLRVVETLVAARVLARGLGIEVGPKEKVTLREVFARWIKEDPQDGGAERDLDKFSNDLGKILLEVDNILGTEAGGRGVTMEEMVEASGLSKAAFDDLYLSWVEVEATHFQLYKRAKHVFSEARRVIQFRQVSEKGSEQALDAIPPMTTRAALGRQMPRPDPESKASLGAQRTLGRIMNESHESCDQLFDCSSPELNQLTELARKAGAFGSRLTGAGWGGCCVSLIPAEAEGAFIEALRSTYPPYQNLAKEEFDQVVFSTQPAVGAGVLEVHDGINFSW